VDGLGVDIDVALSNTLNQGAKFQNRQPQNKQIVLTVGLNPDWDTGQDASDLRELLYAYLVPSYTAGMSVVLRLAGADVVMIDGYVSKIEPNPFAKDPQCQVTIDCLGPYFRAPTKTLVGSLGSLSKTAPVISYPGTAPTGLFIQIVFTGTQNGWEIRTNPAGRSMDISGPAAPATDFLVGDRLYIQTEPGSRYVHWKKSGFGETSLLWMLDAGSDWLSLFKGNNAFTIIGGTAFTWEEISFTAKYWGV
jgi:hypothetical protein